jgi:hypothetical protein
MPTQQSPDDNLPVPPERIERRIYLIRGQKVMLDSDLADLYQVPTKALNQAVRRNLDRFPADFMFQLTADEAQSLRSQFVTLETTETGRGRYSKYAPLVFTEHGVAMLSTVLRSKRAVQMSITIMRVFVKLRQMLASHQDLARKIEQLEAAQRQQTLTQQEHTALLVALVKDIQTLKAPPITRAIGFQISPAKKR